GSCAGEHASASLSAVYMRLEGILALNGCVAIENMLESWRGEQADVRWSRARGRKHMAQPNGPTPSASRRPSRPRLWITLGILGGVLYVAFQAASGAAALYLANPAFFQNKAPAAPAGWHIATPPGQATSYSYAVSADAPGLILACGVSLSTSL